MVRPKHKCRGMWIARIDLGPGPDGKPRRPQKVRASKNAALAALLELKEQLARHGDVPTKGTTVEKWLTEWLDSFVRPTKAPGTYTRYRTAATAHLIPRIGRHRLDKLTPKHLRDAYKDMRDQGVAGSRPQAHAVIRKALNDAMREGMLSRNVAKLVDTPSGDNITRRALTAEQARTLLSYVTAELDGKPRDRNFSRWVMALLTAARPAECLGLTWDRTDLDGRVMDLSWQLKRITFDHGCGEQAEDESWPCGRTHGGRCPERQFRVPDSYDYEQVFGGLCFVRPKTDAGIRLMPMPAPLYAALKAHQEIDDTPNPHNLVWHQADGRPIFQDDDEAAWYTHLEAAGLPRVLLYEARHTTITLLMEAGVDPEIIKAIAGHSSLVVQERYKHADIRHTAEALGKVAGKLYLELLEEPKQVTN